jgi:hypothetical protein
VAATLLTRFTEQSREGLRAPDTDGAFHGCLLQSTVARMQQLGGSFQEAQSEHIACSISTSMPRPA